MDAGSSSSGILGDALRRIGGESANTNLRQAAWVARCVGRGVDAPLRQADVVALADVLEVRSVARDTALFHAGQPRGGVWILRDGRIELSVGSGRRRAVVHILRPGDVDGDVQLLLNMPMPYTARALTDVTYLYLNSASFDPLMAQNPMLARRWMSSIALRLTTSQARILGLLGRSLIEQVARLLLDEADDGTIALTQRTIAAMLGVQRPSLNKVLKALESDGLIVIRYGTISITDQARLAKRAG